MVGLTNTVDTSGVRVFNHVERDASNVLVSNSIAYFSPSR
jgi:hypothetical protein